MDKKWVLFLFFSLSLVLIGGVLFNYFRKTEPENNSDLGSWIALPEPAQDSPISIEGALLRRQSTRQYAPEPLTLAEVSQLLWAGQGINRPGGYRTAPSAGALYPLELYLISGKVVQIPAGVYQYHPDKHSLEKVMMGDVRPELSQAALSQDAVEEAPAVILITGIYQRTTGKYGERGIRYVHMEVGCAAENIYLQAVSLNIGTVFIGAFHDDQIKRLLNLDAQEQPLSLLPIGKIQP
jgi:SagB-type dehydrogenase family enzyme